MKCSKSDNILTQRQKGKAHGSVCFLFVVVSTYQKNCYSKRVVCSPSLVKLYSIRLNESQDINPQRKKIHFSFSSIHLALATKCWTQLSIKTKKQSKYYNSTSINTKNKEKEKRILLLYAHIDL